MLDHKKVSRIWLVDLTGKNKRVSRAALVGRKIDTFVFLTTTWACNNKSLIFLCSL